MSDRLNSDGSASYDRTHDPRNPPNSVTNRRVRRTALGIYLGPLIALFVIAGLGFWYWANRSPLIVPGRGFEAVGTAGQREQPAGEQRQDPVGERGEGEPSPGGFEPGNRPSSTAQELEERGVGSSQQPMFPGIDINRMAVDVSDLLGADSRRLVGRTVELSEVEVAKTTGANGFWVSKGNALVEVFTPDGGASAVKNGQRVSLSGVVEATGQGGVRIRASRVSEE